MTETLPDVKIEPASQALWERFSIVWIIPLIALMIALGVAWQSYNDRGLLIEIAFENSEGVKAGQTELRFRDVTVGLVEKVGFSDGLAKVLVSVRVDKDVAPYIDGGASFWVVRPEVTTRGVTGLGTVLSGVFIEGVWDAELGAPASSFSGLSHAPLIRPDQRGLQISIRGVGDAVLNDNTPIFYRGVTVGRMGAARLSQDGSYTVAEAIIFEPYDKLVNEQTRFWDISGFSFSLGAGGASLNFTSLASLIGGGVTFGNIISGGSRAQDGALFDVYADEASAKASVFNASDVETLLISAIFEENVAGLKLGAPVELSGFKIGEVSSLNGVVDRTQFGDSRVRLNVTLAIQPARLGLPGETNPDTAFAFLAEQVREGLRARLATASILTGGLKVQLIKLEDTEALTLNRDTEPFPIIPTTGSKISDASATAQGLLTRVNDLPVEELLASAIRFLDTATLLVNDPALQDTPEAVQGLLGDIRGLVGSEAAQNVPEAMNAALVRVETLLARLEEERAVDRLVEAVDQAAKAANNVGGAVEGVPALIDQLNALATKAEGLPLEDLVTETTSFVRSAEALVGTDAAKAVPDALATALGSINTTLEELRAENGVARLLAAVDAATKAAEDVGGAVKGVPALVEQLDAVAAKANGLPVENLLAELTKLSASTDAVLDTQDARELPGVLNDALTELQATLTLLREGGLVENANQTMASARLAADQIAGSVEDLPRLIDRMTDVLQQASTTLQSYDGRSELNRGVRDTLRDIQKAADAVSSLARAIERNPNSLLLGR